MKTQIIKVTDLRLRDCVSYDNGESWHYVTDFNRDLGFVVLDAEICGSLKFNVPIDSDKEFIRKDRFYIKDGEIVAYKRSEIKY